MAPKRKSLGQEKPTKKARKEPSPEVVDDEDEISQYAGNSTLVDPMIDQQFSDDSDEDDGEDDEMAGEDDEGGEDDKLEEFDDAPTPAVAGPSRSRGGLYKAPTLAELDELRSAEATGGNTFSLQLSELLDSTLLASTPPASLKTMLGAIHDLVHAIPTLSPVSPAKAEKRLGKGKIPFPGPESVSPLVGEPQWKLSFEAPTEVVVAGSWAVAGGYKRAKGEAGNIDVVVVMPQTMFSAKDRTAYRYFHKRAHYLAVIAEALKKEAAKKLSPLHGAEIKWEQVDDRRPIVVISAGKAQGIKNAVDIRIQASVALDIFQLSTLYPSRALIRKGENEDVASIPTPLISSSILHDTLQKNHLLHLHQLAQSLGAEDRVADKFLALWRIWATRRGLSRNRGGSGWFAAMLLGWVVNGGLLGGKGGDRLQTKRSRGLGRGLGAWGALRAAWEFLAHTDFEASPVFMATGDDQVIPHSEFVNAYKDVFVDPSGTVNILAGWEKGDIELLRYFARETLAMLEDASMDHFAEVFLHDQTLGPATFDEYMIVDASGAEDESDEVEEAEHPSIMTRLMHKAADVVRRGLTDRVRLVHVQPLSATTFAIGLLLNGAAATRVLDMGPASTEEDAGAAFRELWGDLADLRRFKDGSIVESVVWSLTRPEDAALIPSKAVSHLVTRHLGENVTVTSVSSTPEWLSILQVPAEVRDAVSTAGSEKLGFRPMMNAYDALYKLLKNVDSELPLGVLNVSGASELLRYSAPFVPHPLDVSRAQSAPECLGFTPVAEVTLQFESSPRWPEDLAAIQKLKLALFEKLARVIETQMRGVRLNIAFDAGASDIEDSASLEVLLPEGSAFRIRMHYEREKTLLERALEPPPPGIPNQLPLPPKRLVVPALALHNARFIYAPGHHAQLAPMHHRFPSFSTAARLLKRWAASHMLSPHLTPEALELLTAYTYLSPGSLSPPSSATAGFLRTLELLASWDWRATPLFIPLAAVTRDAASASGRPRFNGEIRAAALEAFSKRRATDKDMHTGAFALVTESDESGSRWTAGVGRMIAGRVGALAGASLALVRKGTHEGDLDVTNLFNTPLEHYDAVLHLVPGTRSAEAVHPDSSAWSSTLKFRNLGEERELRLGFDPASLLVADIQRLYGDAVVVFADALGGRALGLLWNPARKAERTFKPFLGYNTAPSATEAALVGLNREAVLAEIARLGKGIVERVERRV